MLLSYAPSVDLRYYIVVIAAAKVGYQVSLVVESCLYTWP